METYSFCGGLTFRPKELDYDQEMFWWKVRARILRRLAKKARVPVPPSGTHLVTLSVRSLRRLQGVGVVMDGPVSRRIQRSLIAAGMSPCEAASLRWESMW